MFKSLNPIKIRKNTNLTSFKIVVTSFSKKKIQQFVNILENEFKTKVSFTYTGKHIVEINALGISKASAAELIIQKEKLTKKDAASIGDSGNDVALFDVTSLPIAVKTKNETVINHTKHHIPKFKNAVAIAIKKYII
jgi:HAD superfamily hydrolase (TIGR01484 family)